ncbi:tyrosinase family protein [Nakamurella endophytica]|uniref:Tyrosinase n=1 Tax=Nakamurella endophytica TaxID=1748367 RepID=A0A917SPP6_9ACTN|nr:tyrosinase family protein [Nakamurella endophytica]GGL91376.1 tyrosinase [Nakamurella endophytica]
MALRKRVDIMTWSTTQVQKLTAAFNKLKANGSYDAFVKRHMDAMLTPTPAGSQSNAAHNGPVFLAWHRAALWEMESALLAIDPTIGGIPYWRWENEAALNGGDPRKSKLWTSSWFGTDGDRTQSDRVLNGPFASWHALLYDNTKKAYVTRSTTGLVRRLGRDSAGSPTLPDQSQITDLNTYKTYDISPYGQSTASFRSRLEGWNAGPRLHNQVHRWVGGDMMVGTSLNDPVFWIHHANVDRIWYRWQQGGGTTLRPYAPISPTGPVGQRSGDTMKFLLSSAWTPAKVQNPHDTTTLGYDYL